MDVPRMIGSRHRAHVPRTVMRRRVTSVISALMAMLGHAVTTRKTALRARALPHAAAALMVPRAVVCMLQASAVTPPAILVTPEPLAPATATPLATPASQVPETPILATPEPLASAMPAVLAEAVGATPLATLLPKRKRPALVSASLWRFSSFFCLWAAALPSTSTLFPAICTKASRKTCAMPW